jgi:hypothetical protein
MTRARDVSRLVTTPPNIYATDSEASSGYLSLSSASSTYVPQNNSMFTGKNKIINGKFDIWQRGTSFTTSGVASQYNADRWVASGDVANSTITQQTFTPGTAPVAGYEGQYYLRYVKGGTTANQMFLIQRVEDVRTFAGQTVTLSYWMKASTTITNEPLIQQNFGSGGSSEVYTTFSTHSVTTSWTRYSVTINVPNVSGKTIGSSSFLGFWPIRYTGTSNVTIEVWGVQAEDGPAATSFIPAGGGSQQAELSLCQRYYQKSFPLEVTPASSYTSTKLELQGSRHQVADVVGFRSQTVFFPEMRVTPTLTFYNGSTNSTTTLRLFSNNNQTQDLSGHGAYAPDVRSFYISFYTGVTVGTSGLSCMVFFNYTADAEL